jgi:hypothetical protein
MRSGIAGGTATAAARAAGHKASLAITGAVLLFVIAFVGRQGRLRAGPWHIKWGECDDATHRFFIRPG